MDEVLEVALAKNPNIRTKTVRALADAIGAAYGLAGDHKQWAVVPQQELAALIAEAMPRLLAAKVAPLAEAADPFAAPAPGAVAPPDQGMAQAFAAVREADLVPQGVPSGKPGWLLPLIVGVLALLVGGAVTLVVMMGR
jgi:serine/threonine-protein kinase